MLQLQAPPLCTPTLRGAARSAHTAASSSVCACAAARASRWSRARSAAARLPGRTLARQPRHAAPPGGASHARQRRGVACNYTSLPERLGDGDDAAAEEQGDRAAGSASSASSIRELEQRMAQQQAAGQADTVAAARSDHTARAPAGVGHGDGDTHARRQQDAWAQQEATARLQDIDEAAVAANPDSAGHPEQHRVRRDGQFDDS